MVQSSPNRIVIFGGTFDPPTLAHVEIIEKILDVFPDCEVCVVPVYRHPSKTSITDYQMRLKMCEDAFAPISDHVKVSTIEGELFSDAEKAGFSYVPTYLVVERISSEFEPDEIYLAVGSDNLRNIRTWYRSESLLDIIRLIEVRRGEISSNDDLVPEMMIQLTEFSDISSGVVKSGKLLYSPYPVLLDFIDEELYFIPELKKRLSMKRFSHSISVAKTAYQIAQNNGLDPYKAFAAGLFHDSAKDLDDEESLELMRRYHPEYVDFPHFSYHQFLGADIARDVFKVDDPEILDSISYHCTGKRDMTEMEKCIYTADKVEPTRDFPTEEMRDSAIVDLDEGFLMVLKDQMRFFRDHEIDYRTNPLSSEMYDHYLVLKEAK